MGASSGMKRAIRAAQLLDRGFAGNGLSWLKPSLGTVDNLVPIDASPPDLHDEMCGPHHKRPASDEDEDTVANNAGASSNASPSMTFFAGGLQPPTMKPSELLAQPAAASEPIQVYTGPTRTGAALIAAVATDTEQQTAEARQEKDAGRVEEARCRYQGCSHQGCAKDTAKDAKPVKHANARPDAAPKSADPSPPPSRPNRRRPPSPPANPPPKIPAATTSPPVNRPRVLRICTELRQRPSAAMPGGAVQDLPGRLPRAAALPNICPKSAMPARHPAASGGNGPEGKYMERIWLKQYPAGVPADIDVTQYASLVELLEESFAKFSDRKAFICMDKSISYRDLDEMSLALGRLSCRARACKRAPASR